MARLRIMLIVLILITIVAIIVTVVVPASVTANSCAAFLDTPLSEVPLRCVPGGLR